MMSESDLIARYELERPALHAWGKMVIHNVKAALQETLGETIEISEFLRIPPAPRMKHTASLVAKAFYRKKEYDDPWLEITDKVGVRFVVLLVEQVAQVRDVIKSSSLWEAREDRHYVLERESNPLEFDYQSVHFVLFSNGEQHFDGTRIPNDTPCEVQIRTLLQHAHSELSHETTFKPTVRVPNNVRRVIARCMALIETTDYSFQEAANIVAKRSAVMHSFCDPFREMLATFAMVETDRKISGDLYNHLQGIAPDVTPQEVIDWASQHASVRSSIAARQGTSLLHRQPLILLAYWLAEHHPEELAKEWPFAPDLLQQIAPPCRDA